MITSVSSIASSGFVTGLAKEREGSGRPLENEGEKGIFSKQEETKSKANAEKKEDFNQLTEEEKKQVEELKKRDQEVRTHEMAHMAAAGALAKGGPTYTYQTGPDGRSYAIGGSVPIDTSKGRTARETIAKAQRIRAAALAPADPSPQDMKVAAQASRMEAEAIQEVQKERTEESEGVNFSGFPRFSREPETRSEGDTLNENFASRVNETYSSHENQNSHSIAVSV